MSGARKSTTGFSGPIELPAKTKGLKDSRWAKPETASDSALRQPDTTNITAPTPSPTISTVQNEAKGRNHDRRARPQQGAPSASQAQVQTRPARLSISLAAKRQPENPLPSRGPLESFLETYPLPSLLPGDLSPPVYLWAMRPVPDPGLERPVQLAFATRHQHAVRYDSLLSRVTNMTAEVGGSYGTAVSLFRASQMQRPMNNTRESDKWHAVQDAKQAAIQSFRDGFGELMKLTREAVARVVVSVNKIPQPPEVNIWDNQHILHQALGYGLFRLTLDRARAFETFVADPRSWGYVGAHDITGNMPKVGEFVAFLQEIVTALRVIGEALR